MKNQTGYTHWVVVILISVIAVGLVGAAWYYENNQEETTTVNTTARKIKEEVLSTVVVFDSYNYYCDINSILFSKRLLY